MYHLKSLPCMMMMTPMLTPTAHHLNQRLPVPSFQHTWYACHICLPPKVVSDSACLTSLPLLFYLWPDPSTLQPSSGISCRSTTAAAHLPPSHQIFCRADQSQMPIYSDCSDTMESCGYNHTLPTMLTKQCNLHTCQEAWPKRAPLWPILQTLPATSSQAKRLKILLPTIPPSQPNTCPLP
jgi:hypothetical protein